MLETLPSLAYHTGHIHPSSIHGSTPSPPLSPDSDISYHAHLSEFLTTLTPLCTSHPYLFQPHLQALLSFLPALILPAMDSGPTPTVGRPFPSHSHSSSTSSSSSSSSSTNANENGRPQSVFVFPPTSTASTEPDINDDEDEKSTLRLSALEFMVSLSEAKPVMVKQASGWTDVIVRACLEGMGELDDETGALEGWLREDVSFVSLVLRLVSTD